MEQKDRINHTWEKSADNYSNIIDNEFDSFRAQKWIERIIKNAPQTRPLKVLDCGCGPGFFSILLSKAGHDVIGIDGAETMLAEARAKAENHGASPKFMLMDCHEPEFPDDTFDLVINRNVTHALCEHRVAYSNWRRVLKPDGILLIFDACWHLTAIDGELREDFKRRHAECMRIYGDDFSRGHDLDDDETEERKEENERRQHILGDLKRPDWDVGLLTGVGFDDIYYERNIIEEMWDDKEKLLYGGTPMFMIRAVK